MVTNAITNVLNNSSALLACFRRNGRFRTTPMYFFYSYWVEKPPRLCFSVGVERSATLSCSWTAVRAIGPSDPTRLKPPSKLLHRSGRVADNACLCKHLRILMGVASLLLRLCYNVSVSRLLVVLELRMLPVCYLFQQMWCKKGYKYNVLEQIRPVCLVPPLLPHLIQAALMLSGQSARQKPPGSVQRLLCNPSLRSALHSMQI